ncbi:MAG: LAGLIDADG family homing endonuclease [Candidatus Hodarchaeota archaeon]
MPTTPPPRDYAPINLWHPTINTTPIPSIDHLHQILDTDYPGLKRNPQYTEWLTDAETHLQLIQHLQGKTHLQRGDRQRLGEALGITRQKFTAWAQDARQPRLYYELTRMLSKTEAQTKITQLHGENHGITSTDDVLARLATYYLTPLHEQSPHHTKRLTQCTQYFHALHLLQDGGTYLDVARTLSVHHSDIMRWLDGSRPDYIELTRHIPTTPPNPGYKWLPLNLDRAFVPTTVIQAPQVITHHKHILPVLDQLHPLTNKTMQRWQTRFGLPNQLDAFYYLLGLIVSDYDKQRARISSTELILNLSKNYTWSEQVGEAASYYFGQLGIHSEEGNPHDSSAGKGMCHKWRTQKSPLITWIIQSVLGLKPGERTTYQPIEANWFLEAPEAQRIAFLQGLNDGDGCASVLDQRLSNTCGPNIPFVQELLATFNIPSTHDKFRVRISSLKGLIRAAKLPFFRHATDRQTNAEKITKMAQVRLIQQPGVSSPEMLDRMIELKDQHFSNGQIAEIIFDEMGISFNPSTIRRRLEALQ